MSRTRAFTWSGLECAKSTLALWVLAVSAAALQLCTTRYGPGLSPDSITYLAIGVNLAEGNGFTNLDGTPWTTHPPGLPLIAALGEIVGVGGELAVRTLNSFCAALIVVWGNRFLRAGPVRSDVVWGATGLLAFSPVMLGITTMAWTEPVFLVAVLVLLVVLQRIWRLRYLGAVDAVQLVLVAWLAFMFRYAGLALIVAMVIIVVTALPRNLANILKAFAVGAAASALPGLWMIRNRADSGTWLAPRLPSPDSFADIIRATCRTIGRWILPVSGLPGKAVTLLATALVVVLVLAFARRVAVDRRERALIAEACIPAATFTVVYLAFAWYSQLTVAIDPLGSRLLSPVYAPMIFFASVALSAGLEGVRRTDEHPHAARATCVVLALVGTLFAGQLLATLRLAHQGVTQGIGYNSARWRESEAARVLNRLPNVDTSIIYSNNEIGLWAASGRHPLFKAPRFAGVRNTPVTGELEQFRDETTCPGRAVLLIMFTDGDPRSYSVAQIGEVVHLVLIAEAADGSLYSVPASGCN